MIPRVSKEVEPYRRTPCQLHCVKIMTQWQDPVTRSLGQRDPQRKPLSPICDLPIPPLFSPSPFICQPPASSSHPLFPLCHPGLSFFFPPSISYVVSHSAFPGDHSSLQSLPFLAGKCHPHFAFHSWWLSVLPPHPGQDQCFTVATNTVVLSQALWVAFQLLGSWGKHCS